MKIPSLVIALTIVAGVAYPAHTEPVPPTLTFTARLVKDSVAVEGNIALQVSLFRTPTEGKAVWTETVSGIAHGGLVAVRLGDQEPLHKAFYGGGALYLEVAINGTALTPRLGIASVPYALRADQASSADTLAGVSVDKLQRPIKGECSANTSIRAISPSGDITCEPDDNTTYGAGRGLQLSGTRFGVDFADVQRRLNGSCERGQAIRAVDSEGGLTCEPMPAVTIAETLATKAGDPAARTGQARTLCALTLVDGAGAGHGCRLELKEGGIWFLSASASGAGSSATCQAKCF